MVMVTLTVAGAWYGWLRLWSGSIWPVTLAHSAFNNIMEGAGAAAITASPVAMAYTTTETGVATMLVVLLLAGYLLTRRAADFTVPGSTRGPAPHGTEGVTNR
jgi:membrane protease YdiL (CAAX protease family)